MLASNEKGLTYNLFRCLLWIDSGTRPLNTEDEIMTTDYSDVLPQAQASKYLGIAENTLRGWRREGIGPTYFRAGEKLIRYRRVDLDQWIAARLTEPTAQSK